MRIAKPCSRCGGVKPLEDYHRRAASPDGRQSICKDCLRAAAKAPISRTEKRCSRCGEVKPLADFHRRESSPDGRQYICIACMSKVSADVARVYEQEARHGETAKQIAEEIIRKYGYAIPAGNHTWQEIIGLFPKCDTCGKRYPLTAYPCRGTIRSTVCKTCTH